MTDAELAELVDAHDSGSCGASLPGSSPGFRIPKAKKVWGMEKSLNLLTKLLILYCLGSFSRAIRSITSREAICP